MTDELIRDRRFCRRWAPGAGVPLRHARLRGGREVTVCDVSRSGALVEGPARLLPGTHVDVHLLTTTGRVLVRCRVTRAWVWRIADGVVYRAGLVFERAVELEEGG